MYVAPACSWLALTTRFGPSMPVEDAAMERSTSDGITDQVNCTGSCCIDSSLESAALPRRTSFSSGFCSLC